MTVPRIFHLSPLSAEECDLMVRSCPADVAIDMVQRVGDTRWEAMLARADAVITGGHVLTPAELARAPRLKAVQMRGVGWQDRVPIEGLRARRIRLAICSEGTAQAVAEHALMLILAVLRNLRIADSSIRGGCYRHGDPVLRRKSHRLAGATVGLIGMGNTARALVRLLQPFKIKGYYYSRNPLNPTDGDLLHFTQVPLDRLLADSDIVSLHLPGGAETRNILGAREIAMMKPGAILVNTARGSLVDQAALAAALHAGHLAGAGLDVFDPEPPDFRDVLFAHPNVIVTPHVAAAQLETFASKIDFCVGNLSCFLRGGTLREEVEL